MPFIAWGPVCMAHEDHEDKHCPMTICISIYRCESISIQMCMRNCFGSSVGLAPMVCPSSPSPFPRYGSRVSRKSRAYSAREWCFPGLRKPLDVARVGGDRQKASRILEEEKGKGIRKCQTVASRYQGQTVASRLASSIQGAASRTQGQTTANARSPSPFPPKRGPF